MFLSPYAVKSIESKGRSREETPCPLRTDFQRDRDRIIHCKAFRRLKNKTQVFLAPEGDHYRTRMTHTLDVTQIARSIARALKLNEDLCEASALGHDLGHTPFGHTGERVLEKLTDGYFQHNKQSLRVVEFLENNGQGLNLTYEVKDGILNHRSACNARTLEGKVVMFADKIAYLNHDIDDAIRAGALHIEEIPKPIIETLGDNASKRINSMITSIFRASSGKNFVQMEDNVQQVTNLWRDFMFEKVYNVNGSSVENVKAYKVVEYLYEHFYNNQQLMPIGYYEMTDKYPLQMVVCDYIASMSDTYAINLFSNLVIPKRWDVL
ncbi:MAG: deoxyguanosinetriphosphate triphosphohydrolase [Clostridia bacterium]